QFVSGSEAAPHSGQDNLRRDASSTNPHFMAALVLEGTFTALVTPFLPDASAVDFDALERLVDAQIEAGISGLVPCGTTGESPTLSDVEQVEVIRRVVAR